MAELTTLARPYAKAAFEHAQAHQQLASWSAMLGLAAAVSQDDTMQRVLKAPRLTSAEKATTFNEVCGDKFDAQARNFISVVAENGRLDLLLEIAAQFELYKAEQEKSVDLEVTSAFALSTEQQTNSPRFSTHGSAEKCVCMLTRKTPPSSVVWLSAQATWLSMARFAAKSRSWPKR